MIKNLINKIRQNYDISKIKDIIVIILTILLNINLGYNLSRYAHEGIKEYFARTNKFYFNCDKLSPTGSNIEMTNWSGVGEYTVVFNMNSLNNRYVKSEENIEYNISYSCSSNVTCSIENNKTNGTISSNTNTDSFTIVITVPSDTILHDQDAVELNVETNATSPYTKRLYGTFRLVVGHYGLSYEIEDSPNSPYLTLKNTNTLDYYVVREAFGDYSVGAQIDIDTYQGLNAADKEKCASSIITLSFNPNDILLDMTSDIYQNAENVVTRTIDNYEYIESISFKIDAMSSNNVKFYKKNVSMDYSYPNSSNNSVISVTYS